MVTVLIASFILLAVISFALYRSRHTALPDDDANPALLPPPPTEFKSLFEDPAAEARARAAQREKESAEKRAKLLARAAEGEKQTLNEAHASGDGKLYEQVLHTLVERAGENEKQLFALASYVARADSLPVNKKLAAAFLESWKLSPSRHATAQMLHLCALAGDAALYQQAIETTLRYWQEQKLSDMTAEELTRLIESEFWLIPSTARNSGAGFLLKRKLATVRRELAADKTVTSDE
jgi:hypothetical protein